jgi:hypothetical protein
MFYYMIWVYVAHRDVVLRLFRVEWEVFYSWLLIIHLRCLEAFLRNGRGRLKLVYVILETVDFKHRQCLIVHVSTKSLTTGCTCERLFQKRVMCTKYDIDVLDI